METKLSNPSISKIQMHSDDKNKIFMIDGGEILSFIVNSCIPTYNFQPLRSSNISK